MSTFILVWVLVMAAPSPQSAPVISAPLVDLESCERIQRAVQLGSYRHTQCVQIKIPK
jgi:hypothetical protein